jgi:hypothetical protein
LEFSIIGRGVVCGTRLVLVSSSSSLVKQFLEVFE